MEMVVKKLIMLFSCVTWLRIGTVWVLEESFFVNSFNVLNYYPEHHVKMSDLKVNENYVLKQSNTINVEMALSALKGVHAEESEHAQFKELEEEIPLELNQWSRIKKDDFFQTDDNENASLSNNTSYHAMKEKENAMKGMPDPYYIHNINDETGDIIFYHNNEELENKEMLYKGTYIPRIYNSTFLILLILSAYLSSIKIILRGFLYGKNTAKDFIPRVSTLFTFFMSLRFLLQIFPISLATFICLILTYYFSTISMKPCEYIFFLKDSKIKKEPIGWVFIVCIKSLLFGHLLYHFLFSVNILNKLIPLMNNNNLLLYLFYLSVSSCLTALIFLVLTSNILAAKKTQNFVFSLLSSYLLVSCYTYIHNFVLLRILDNTTIFQIEPIMFFSYKPIFVYNTQNNIAVTFLFVMTIISLVLPRWLKKLGIFGKRRKNVNKGSNLYDTFLRFWT